MSNFRDRVAWAARAQTGLTRQRGPMGHCPPSGLTEEAAARLFASNQQGYAGQAMGTHAPPAYMNVHSHPSQQGEACPQNVNDNRFSCQASMCAEQPPVCGCNVLGANTIEDNGGTGLAPGATGNLAIDAGDSCRYQPRSLFIAAYAASTDPGLLLNPCQGCPVLLLNATVGTIPMIRRTGENSFGILTDAYSDRKELTCVDWAPFTSVRNQGLRLTFLQINATLNYHIFVVLWGDNLG